MKIISWNVNGLKSCCRKGFLHFLADTKPDVICCQEIKTHCNLNTPGYLQYWNPAERPGYSGTLTLTRREPLSCVLGMGKPELDREGRLITLEYKNFYLINAYVPNINPHNSRTARTTGWNGRGGCENMCLNSVNPSYSAEILTRPERG